MREHAHIRCPLNIIMPTENVGTAARDTHITQRQLKDAVGSCVIIAVGVLGAAHAPNKRAGLVINHNFCNSFGLVFFHPSDICHHIRCPFGNLSPNLIKTPNTLADKLLIFPAIFKNVPQQTPYEGDIRSRAQPDKFCCVGCGS